MHEDFIYLIEKTLGQFSNILHACPSDLVEQYAKKFNGDPAKGEHIKTARSFLAAQKAAKVK